MPCEKSQYLFDQFSSLSSVDGVTSFSQSSDVAALVAAFRLKGEVQALSAKSDATRRSIARRDVSFVFMVFYPFNNRNSS